jgi:flagellar biosynthesis/type III secretory pathway chaperone
MAPRVSKPTTTLPPRPAISSTLQPRPGAQGQPQARPASGPGGRPQAKIDDMMQVIRQLCDLLTKENQSLKRHKTEDVKAFAERKEQLARLYQGHMNAIHRDKGLVKGLEPARRQALTQQAMRLGELMQENAALLKGNIQSINLFFKAVTDAVRERQEKMSAAYSRRGAMSGYITKRSLAVSFNQTL